MNTLSRSLRESAKLLLLGSILILAACGADADNASPAINGPSNNSAGGNNADNNAIPDTNNPDNPDNNNTPANNDTPANNNTPANNTANNNIPANNDPSTCTDETCGEGQICENDTCVDGCREHADCLDGQICSDNHVCVECRDDNDCSLGTICAENSCVEGCRDDQGCETGSICDESLCITGCRDDQSCGAGMICDESLCVDGCRNDDSCALGMICDENSCVTGCRDDQGCEEGFVCDENLCVEGCRDDQGCENDSICLEGACEPLGLACRIDEHCTENNTCNLETMRCEVAETCTDDALEPNNDPENATPLVEGSQNATLCPGDVDHFSLSYEEGDLVTLHFDLAPSTGSIVVAVSNASETLHTFSFAQSGEEHVVLEEAESAGSLRVALSGQEEGAGIYSIAVEIGSAQACMDTTLYLDTDMDGYGDIDAAEQICLEEGETPEGYANRAGDCAPDDPWANPGAEEICGDNLDDNCDEVDVDCPTSQPGVSTPTWSCNNNAPPPNVYAWARFDNGEGYFRNGGCFVFFEGPSGEFYVKHTLERVNQDPSCNSPNGCVCPSLGNSPSYDRRLYAFTQDPDQENCAEIRLEDHAGEEQVVSNSCRKYLYQLHDYEIPYSYVARNAASLERRLSLFSTVEVACAEDYPHRNLPYQTLMRSEIVRNPNFGTP